MRCEDLLLGHPNGVLAEADEIEEIVLEAGPPQPTEAAKNVAPICESASMAWETSYTSDLVIHRVARWNRAANALRENGIRHQLQQL